MDVVAPGVGILSTAATPSNEYNSYDGTSYAAPQVSAVAALILSIRPDLSRSQVRKAIEGNCNKNLAGFTVTQIRPNGMWNDKLGFGLLDASSAVYSIAPYIYGPSSLCIGTSSTFSAYNIPAGITWDKSSNLTLTGSGNSVSVTATSGSSGWVSIKLGSKELARNVLLVSSQPVFDYIYGPEYASPDGSENLYVAEFLGCPPTSYSWSVSGAPSSWYSITEYGHFAYIKFFGEATYYISVTGSNACCSSYGHLFVEAYNHDKQSYKYYPNPASDILTVEIDQQDITKARSIHGFYTGNKLSNFNPTFDIRLYDEFGILHHHSTTNKVGVVQIDLSGLPNGTYYLHIHNGVSKQPMKAQIIVKR